MRETFVLDLAAPVPVGNRVELTTYAQSVEVGVFGGRTELRELPNDALVRDLATGIEYASARLFSQMTFENAWFKAEVYSEALTPKVQPRRTVTGKVVACRVLTHFVGDSGGCTRLEVELDG